MTNKKGKFALESNIATSKTFAVEWLKIFPTQQQMFGLVTNGLVKILRVSLVEQYSKDHSFSQKN